MADERPLSSMLGTEVLHDVMEVMLRIPERPLPMAIEDLTAGKTPLAAAITAKGVQASKNDSIRALAEKVAQIQQTPVTFDADDYSAIVSGNGALYDIVKEGMNHIRGEYAAMVVGEFMKDADTIALSGADAYYTSDGDFYTSNTTHTWHDDDTKANRYVIYYFTNEGSDYVIGSAETCPSSLMIYGKIGNFVCNVTGYIRNIFCYGEMENLTFNATMNLVGNLFLKMKENKNRLLTNENNIYSLVLYCNKISNSNVLYTNGNFSGLKYATIYAQSIENSVIFNETSYNNGFDYLLVARFPITKSLVGTRINTGSQTQQRIHPLHRIIEVLFDELETMSGSTLISLPYSTEKDYALERIYAPCLVYANSSICEIGSCPSVIDIEVGAMTTNLNVSSWNPTNVISDPTKLATLNANIRNHIAAKVSDRTGQSALTFTVSTNLYNNLEQATKDAFTAKGWICAGA